jgi:hypothetical protein
MKFNQRYSFPQGNSFTADSIALLAIKSFASMPDILKNNFRMAIVCCWLLILSLADLSQALGAQPSVRSIGTPEINHGTSPFLEEPPKTVVTSSFQDVGDNKSKITRRSYRRIGSADVTEIYPHSVLPPSVHCGVVNHIEFFVQTDFGDADLAFSPTISGIVAMPFGRHGEKSFFANVDTFGTSGYYPAEKNIKESLIFSIGLTMDDGDYYVITQRYPPQFQEGDTVMRNKDGMLEQANCIPNDLELHNLESPQ